MVEKLVPKLRFNEFHDGWNTIFLNNILSFKNGFNASKDQYGFGTKFINVTDILENNYLTYDNIQDYVNVDENELSNYIIEYGDIVFQRSSENREEVGTANVYLGSQPCVYGGFVIRGKKEGNYNPFFLKELLQSTRVRKEITSWSGGSTRYNIGQDSLNKISVSLPSIEEQNKIADLLLKVYEKIDLLNYKFQCYNNFKKYLMQQIFTQKLRFNNFDSEWEFKKLGRVSTVKDGTHDSPKYVSNGYPLITSKNLINGKIDFENVNYISKEDYDNINKRSNVNKGDILFGMIGTIGNPLIVETDEFAIKNVALIKEKEELLNKFLIHVLETDLINKQFYRLNAGGTQKFIALGLIKDLLVPIPSIEEQLKISEFLSTVNLNLNSCENQISNMKKFKNGLLQQMFI